MDEAAEVRAFLKKYTPVSSVFIDDFFSLYSIDSRPGSFVVDLDVASKWLCTRTFSLKRTLVQSYTRDVDYRIQSLQPYY